jgi:cation/acetate symporter
MINPNISEKTNFGLLWAAAVAVIIAGYFGINPPGVAAVVALAFGLAALFPAIILGILMKKNEQRGAIASMIIGLLLMLSIC